MLDQKPLFQLVAGHVALDFANTLDNRYAPGRTVDMIAAYAEFLRFCVQAGVITDAQAVALGRVKKDRERVMQQVTELRECLYRIFQAAAEKQSAAATDLELLSGWLRSGAQQRELISTGAARFERRWQDIEHSLVSPLWLIADAAADLLLSELVERVRECAHDTCRWLFLDSSKNHSRRWCDMKICGNRVKAKNHYLRGRDPRSTEA